MEILQDNATALFTQCEIGAFVLPIIQGKAEANPVNLSASGIITLPDPFTSSDIKRVTGFRLGLIIPREARLVVVQRNLLGFQGLYHNAALQVFKEEEWQTWIMLDHIRVYRRGGISWTEWKAIVPNRVDVWSLTPTGLARLVQYGVIVRDNEVAGLRGDDFRFRLHEELRGEWQLYDFRGEVVGKPTNLIWGIFDVRRTILDNHDFQTLLAKTSLPNWTGTEEELGVPLEPPEESGLGIIDWWSPFIHRRGGGPCLISDKSYPSAWVCAEDFQGEPDSDGIIRLPRGTVVSYKNIGALGERDYKLLEVRRVS